MAGGTSAAGASGGAVDPDPWKALAGAIVGFTVGLTGMGGGTLMTPILVLVFGVDRYRRVE